MNSSYFRDYYQKQKSMGLCITGDKKPICKGSTVHCKFHFISHREATREARSIKHMRKQLF